MESLGGRLVGTLLLLTAVWAQTPASRQTPAVPTLRATTNLVTVDFTARTPEGRLVDDLRRDDVRVFEDGQPQTIAFFNSSHEVPLTVGVVVDTSGSQRHFLEQRKRDLRDFLKATLQPGDAAFLVSFDNPVRLVSDVSGPGEDLVAAIDAAADRKHQRPALLGPPDERDLGSAVFDAVFYSVEERLAGRAGRKALVLFSDGEDNASSHDLIETIRRAQEANVPVFTIRYTTLEHGRMTPRNHYGASVMQHLAEETGGETFDASRNSPSEYLAAVTRALRNGYELAYYPRNSLDDRGFRKLSLESLRPDVSLRARTGYAPTPE
jgi:Ca-activated chloride channel family protein